MFAAVTAFGAELANSFILIPYFLFLWKIYFFSVAILVVCWEIFAKNMKKWDRKLNRRSMWFNSKRSELFHALAAPLIYAPWETRLFMIGMGPILFAFFWLVCFVSYALVYWFIAPFFRCFFRRLLQFEDIVTMHFEYEEEAIVILSWIVCLRIAYIAHWYFIGIPLVGPFV